MLAASPSSRSGSSGPRAGDGSSNLEPASPSAGGGCALSLQGAPVIHFIATTPFGM